MGSIRRFEDIRAWQLARALTREVYRLTNEGRFGRDYRFADQIRAASCSIMSNIADGFERDSLREFVQFLKVARGSCAEVRSLLYVALDAGYIDSAQFSDLLLMTDEIGRVTAGLKDSVERRVVSKEHSVRDDLDADSEYRWVISPDPVPATAATSSALGTRHSALQEPA